jgi:Arc/MetJ family transcription regulator
LDILTGVKTTVDVDKELAAEAARVLGTETLKHTVNTALAEIVRARRREELARALLDGTLAVPAPEEVTRQRKPRLPVGALEDFFSRPADDAA